VKNAYTLLARVVKENKYQFVYLFMDHGIDIRKLGKVEDFIEEVGFFKSFLKALF
jgi:hypothetical protein